VSKLKRLIVIGLVMSLFGSGEASAENRIDVEVTADYFGKYIWRGQNIDDDPVLQPSISGGYRNLTATIWGNLELTNINDKSGDFSELDYSFDYSDMLPGIDGIGYSVGVIYYDFPSRAADGTKPPDTTELYWGLTFDLPLNPSVTAYHDVDEADGSYVSLAIIHSTEAIARLGQTPIRMEIGASLGWGSSSYNRYYWGTDRSRMQDLAFLVSFPVQFASWTVIPSVNYVTLVSSDIRDTDAYGTDSDFFVAGVGLSKKF
jgi:hypothetical protein